MKPTESNADSPDWTADLESRYQKYLDAERKLLDTGPLGRLARAALIRPELRERLMSSPAETLASMRIDVEPGVTVHVLENRKDLRYVLLPAFKREKSERPTQTSGPLDLSDDDLTSDPIAMRFLQDDFVDTFIDRKADVMPSDAATADIGDEIIEDITGFENLPGGGSDSKMADRRNDADARDVNKDAV
jgi:hypothetical protein